MAKYFDYFPKTFYNLDDTTALQTVTNIISRFAFEETLKKNSSAFYYYEVKESDTPEIIASKYYNNPERHWIVLLFNNIIDPQWDWPLKYDEFNNFIEKKYSTVEYANTANTSVSGLSWAKNVDNVHSYYKIITTTIPSEGATNTETIEISSNEYANTPSLSSNNFTLYNNTAIVETTTKKKMTYYEYEESLNENRRKIKLLKSEFAAEVEKEFKRVIKL